LQKLLIREGQLQIRPGNTFDLTFDIFDKGCCIVDRVIFSKEDIILLAG